MDLLNLVDLMILIFLKEIAILMIHMPNSFWESKIFFSILGEVIFDQLYHLILIFSLFLLCLKNG